MNQRITTLSQTIQADSNDRPVVIRTASPRSGAGTQTVSGPTENGLLFSTYVLYDELPAELKERVKTWVEAVTQ